MFGSVELVNLEQGTEEWHRWRAAGLGASDVYKIVSSDVLAEELVFQKLTGTSWTFPVFVREAMERGHRLEPEARQLFCEQTGLEVLPVCVQSSIVPFYRASLDGATKDLLTIVEIKCCGEKTRRRIAALGEPIPEHYYQIQYQLLLTRAVRAFYVSYAPDEPLFYCPVFPDWQTQSRIAEAIEYFRRTYLAAKGQPDVVAVVSCQHSPPQAVVSRLTNGYGYACAALPARGTVVPVMSLAEIVEIENATNRAGLSLMTVDGSCTDCRLSAKFVLPDALDETLSLWGVLPVR